MKIMFSLFCSSIPLTIRIVVHPTIHSHTHAWVFIHAVSSLLSETLLRWELLRLLLRRELWGLVLLRCELLRLLLGWELLRLLLRWVLLLLRRVLLSISQARQVKVVEIVLNLNCLSRHHLRRPILSKLHWNLILRNERENDLKFD